MRVAVPPAAIPVPTEDVPPDVMPEPKPVKIATVRAAKPATATALPKPRPDEATGGMQTIVVYISASIRERLRNGAGEHTFTEVVLMALDATHSSLQTKFGESASTTKSMFAGRGRPTSRRHSEPHVQVSLRPLRDDLAVIDQLTEGLNAPSRSAMINAALDEYLPQDS